jgi:hypothetical protein
MLLATGCGWFRPFHPTPLDALTESPGYLINPDHYIADSVVALQRQEVAGGLVLLYRWQTRQSQSAGTYCVAATFVTPAGKGWRAQSSGSLGRAFSSGCQIPPDTFAAGYTVGANITSLTTAYGLAPRGDAVRIEWSDGQIDVVSPENGSFLLSRPETLAVRRIELLGADGQVLEDEEW